MNIVIIGYGRMGQIIHQIATERGHDVVKIIDYSNRFEMEDLKNSSYKVDVAIEFTVPSEARVNVSNCLRMGIPVVTGTTGWNEELDDIKNMSHDLRVGFLQASNFSLGMNIVFALNKFLAKMMNASNIYQPKITEIHHTQKLDKPSGTAITLANELIKNIDNIYGWELDSTAENMLNIEAIREENVPGIHRINYQSEFDEIEISHKAKSRKGFALGAVIAAEFLAGKKRAYEMSDVIESLIKATYPE